MKTLVEVELTNVVPFKKALLNLDYQGITLIRGLNKDAGAAGDKVSNAAGKSVLVGSIPDLIVDESPSGKEVKIKGAKTLAQSIRLKVRTGKHEYDFKRTVGKGKEYEVLRDGQPTNSRTVKYNQEYISRILGLTEAQLYSRLYIDSTIPHPLFNMSSAVKEAYVVELFNLNDIDHIRQLLNAELRVLTKKTIELKTLQSSIDDLKVDRLPSEERLSSKTRLTELQEQQSKLTASLQASQAVSELMAFERQHKGLIVELRTLCTLDELPQQLKLIKQKVAQLKEQREAALDWSTYDRLVRLYKKASGPAEEAMAQLGLTSASEVQKRVHRLREVEGQLKALERSLPDPLEAPKKVERPEYDRDECVSKNMALRHELQNIKVLKSGTCPTCGQPVSTRPAAKVEAELEKWSRRVMQADRWQLYTRQKEAHQSWVAATEQTEQKLAKLRRIRSKLLPALEVAKLLEDVPSKPRTPNSERPTSFDEQKLERLQHKMQVLQHGYDLLDPLQSCEQLTDRQRAKATQSSKFVQDINHIQSEISELTAKLAKQSEIGRRLKSLLERAAVLQEECQDEKLLRALVTAYSTQGLKRYMIERHLKMLEQQINKYRKIFFAEDYEFEFAYGAKLNMLVHRKYGSKVRSSDVRKLSGSEKRFLTLLLVVSTITLLPAAKRLNVLILDEPEANMGPDFVNKLIGILPVMQKLIPHIIFVTPRTEINIPNSRVLTVVKHGGTATLTEKEF